MAGNCFVHSLEGTPPDLKLVPAVFFQTGLAARLLDSLCIHRTVSIHGGAAMKVDVNSAFSIVAGDAG